MPASDVYVVGLGTNEKPLSRTIRRATEGWCSHAWLEYSSLRFGGMWTIHATAEGVRRERVLDVWARYPTMKRYEVRHDLSPGIVRAVEAIGTPYDYGATIFNVLLFYLMRHGLYNNQNIMRTEGLYNCSELVTSILKWSYVPGHREMDPEATPPIKLDSICRGGKPTIVEV